MIIDGCSGVVDDELATHVALLRIVTAQDIEVVDHGDGPAARIRQGVAPERVISTVDPDTRHGHRSRRDHYDGYKLHVSTDIDSDLITAIEASSATTHDAAVVDALLDAEPVAVAEVIADTHYGSADTRRTLGAAGVELVAPPQPSSAPKGLFSKDAFTIDLNAGTVTCPAGHVALIIGRREGRRIQVRFPVAVCASCPLRAQCTNKPAAGRVIEIGPNEELLGPARAARWTPEFRVRYRRRARAERKIAQVKSRQTKLPWRGLIKARGWAHLRGRCAQPRPHRTPRPPRMNPTPQRRQHPHTRSTTHSDLVVTRPSRNSPEPPRTRKPLPTTQLGPGLDDDRRREGAAVGNRMAARRERVH